MPVYEFKCSECGAKFDKLTRSYKTAGTVCPSCGSAQTKKMVTLPGMCLWTNHDGATVPKPSAEPVQPSGSGPA